MKRTEVGRAEMATEVEVLEGRSEVAREIARLRNLTKIACGERFGGMTVFGSNGFCHFAWSVDYGQMIRVGPPPNFVGSFAVARSREDVICLMAIYGKGKIRQRCREVAVRIARRMKAREINADEEIWCLSVRHRCVVIGKGLIEKVGPYETEIWIAGLRMRKRLILVPRDVGVSSLLWAIGGSFAQREGWQSKAAEDAKAAAVIEKLRAWGRGSELDLARDV